MKKLFLLLIASSSLSMMGMTMDDAEKALAIIPNLEDIESFSTEKFGPLIETYHKDNKPFMLARVESQGSSKAYFYDAQELHKTFTQNTNGIFKPSSTYKNSLDNLAITKIDYYKITKGEDKKDSTSATTTPSLVSTYVGSYDEFVQPVRRWNALFPHNAMPIPNAITREDMIHTLAVNQALFRSLENPTARTRLINGAPPHGPTPLCQTDYNRERDNCCSQCVGICFAPIFCAIGLVVDTVLAPCVWQNRKDNPEGKEGRHHYCFMMRRVCKECAGIASIDIHGNNNDLALFGPSCRADCNVPGWDSTDPNS